VRKALTRLLLLAAVVCTLLGATAAPPAAAAPPCWKVLLNDWLDGRIDHLYPVSCYRDAINHLPTDIETYSSARDDINRALQARIAGKAAPPNQGNGGGTPPAGSGGNSGSGPSSGGDSGGGNGPVNNAIGAGRPSSVTSVPLPLIVLSAIAGLLLALGAIGLIARRMQTKRLQMRPAESPAQPPNT
jgi:hypothetical protein